MKDKKRTSDPHSPFNHDIIHKKLLWDISWMPLETRDFLEDAFGVYG